MRIHTALLVLATAAAAAAPALGFTDGWDSDVEIPARVWTTARIQWAQSFHPGNPTASDLVNDVTPPPREMWCAPEQWPQYCKAWEAHMDVWLHYYLDIPYDEPLPQIPTWPKECPSSCSRF